MGNKEKKISKEDAFKILIVGIFIGIIIGGMFGVFLIGIQLQKERMKNDIIVKWCEDGFEEIGNKCIENMRSIERLCLFSNDLHFREFLNETEGKEIAYAPLECFSEDGKYYNVECAEEEK